MSDSFVPRSSSKSKNGCKQETYIQTYEIPEGLVLEKTVIEFYCEDEERYELKESFRAECLPETGPIQVPSCRPSECSHQTFHIYFWSLKMPSLSVLTIRGWGGISTSFFFEIRHFSEVSKEPNALCTLKEIAPRMLKPRRTIHYTSAEADCLFLMLTDLQAAVTDFFISLFFIFFHHVLIDSFLFFLF